jgi:predicted nucleotidyltransferase component of viral defense system
LAAIAAVDTGEFRLVFGGGTALSRAYKLTKRMSEDADLKIVWGRAIKLARLRLGLLNAPS